MDFDKQFNIKHWSLEQNGLHYHSDLFSRNARFLRIKGIAINHIAKKKTAQLKIKLL